MIMGFLFNVVQMLLSAARFVVIAHLILSLLISFNIINTHNDFVRTLWDVLERLLAPIYRPIRRMMPDTGALDLSPMVLLLGLKVADMGLSQLVNSYYL
jgi:YggT family protein